MRTDYKNIEVGEIIKSTGFYFKQEIDIAELFNDFGKNHRRLRVFNEKGCACANPACGFVGTRLILSIDKCGGLHWDVYTDNLILMNIDHIVARSNGGNSYIKNLQPMCKFCNSLKGDKHITNEELAELLLNKLRVNKNKKTPHKIRELRD
jgi:hypothetical protein